jgi:hypothetical protein
MFSALVMQIIYLILFIHSVQAALEVSISNVREITPDRLLIANATGGADKMCAHMGATRCRQIDDVSIYGVVVVGAGGQSSGMRVERKVWVGVFALVVAVAAVA